MALDGGIRNNGLMAATTKDPSVVPARRRLDLRTAGLSLVAAGALALIVLGFASAKTGKQAVTITDPAVERLIPKPDDLVLRQSQVGVDLAPGYRGYLVIDGQVIPTYDVQAANVTPGQNTNVGQPLDARYDSGQNTVLYSPQVGATIEAFSPGPHTISAFFWRDGVDSRDQARHITWTFRVS